MKRFQILLLLVGLTTGCSHEPPLPELSEGEHEAFFAYKKSNLNNDLAWVVPQLQQLASEYNFVPEFINRYGYPLWNYTKSLSSSDQIIMVVPTLENNQLSHY
jgi:hypothetical protein